MLKMPNRRLQWLQKVKKPLARFFWHLVWPKIEEDRLPGSSPSNLLSLDRQNAPLLSQPSPHTLLCVKTQHWSATAQTVQTVGQLWVRLAPNRQGRGRVTHVTVRLNNKKKGQDFKSKCYHDKWRALVV
jgi:hypothetical protein